MTLDLEKFISNSIKTQAKIQHLDFFTKTTKNVPDSVKSIISKEYGENYLLDADYVSFFWGTLGKEEIKKLFNVVDKALGKSANKLTDTDFKKMSIDQPEEDDSSEEEEESPSKDDVEEPIEDTTASNEDGSNEQLDEDDEIEDTAAPKKNYFFLKITLK